ncbi:restriction endonuclease [Actinomadura scrupuli]|uniref:restriction endonuclease n=1 Tax=Actinomadura scrupuli TaxID=559629 RepID=UPI003D97CC3F
MANEEQEVSLTIGRTIFRRTWSRTPSFLTFLFSVVDLFVDGPVPGHAPESRPQDPTPDRTATTVGYRTTVVAAPRVLDRHGYTTEFLSEIYACFRPELDQHVRWSIEEDLRDLVTFAREQGRESELSWMGELQSEVEAHCANSAGSSLEDLRAFTAMLRELMEPTPLPPNVGLGNPLSDFDELGDLIATAGRTWPASIMRVATLFTPAYLTDYPEPVMVVYLRLLLDAAPKHMVVELDLSHVVANKTDARALHTGLAIRLMNKLDLYQRMFRPLSDREPEVRDLYARTQIRQLLDQLDQPAHAAKAKGDLLEKLMNQIFSSEPGLQVVQANYLTGDEEIDLIIKNNVDRPFWHNLGSALIFVECKNWSGPVGPNEVRNFEGKLLNHAGLVKVGILVAPNGFTKNVETAIRRSSRDLHTLLLIDRTDLDHLASGTDHVLDWIENLLCRPI